MNRALRALGVVFFLCLVARTNAALHCDLLEGKVGGDRIPLVFYAAGYTEADRALYEQDVTGIRDSIFHQPPFRRYRDRFVVVRAWTPSLRSGLVDTPNDSTFGGIGITNHMPTLDWAALNRLVFDDTSFHCRDWDHHSQVVAHGVVLANASSMGGLAFGPGWTIAPRDMPGTTLHELGHVLGGLSEEYGEATDGRGGSWNPLGDPVRPIRNTWRSPSRDSIPWRVWLDPSTPVPTPQISAWEGKIGAFEGGDGLATGRYRPFLECRMRNGNRAFCPVCQEALAEGILTSSPSESSRTFGLDSISPQTGGRGPWTYQAVVTDGKVVVRPFRDSLPPTLRWRFRGADLPGSREEVWVDSLSGDGILEAILAQSSPFIRNPDLIPRDTLRWTVRKSSGAVARKGRMDAIRRIGPGLFLVSGVSELPIARDLQGRSLGLIVVGVVADGRIVKVKGSMGPVVWESSPGVGVIELLH
ncbi:MAG: hypothetical protein IPO40_02260 [Fibrobacteres bacterium]|nr:hypothetical protein [Fibrobacterota bacterium]